MPQNDQELEVVESPPLALDLSRSGGGRTNSRHGGGILLVFDARVTGTTTRTSVQWS